MWTTKLNWNFSLSFPVNMIRSCASHQREGNSTTTKISFRLIFACQVVLVMKLTQTRVQPRGSRTPRRKAFRPKWNEINNSSSSALCMCTRAHAGPHMSRREREQKKEIATRTHAHTYVRTRARAGVLSQIYKWKIQHIPLAASAVSEFFFFFLFKAFFNWEF